MLPCLSALMLCGVLNCDGFSLACSPPEPREPQDLIQFPFLSILAMRELRYPSLMKMLFQKIRHRLERDERYVDVRGWRPLGECRKGQVHTSGVRQHQNQRGSDQCHQQPGMTLHRILLSTVMFFFTPFRPG